MFVSIKRETIDGNYLELYWKPNEPVMWRINVHCEGTLAATMDLSPSAMNGAPAIVVDSVFVWPSYRRKGLANLLFKFVFDYFGNTTYMLTPSVDHNVRFDVEAWYKRLNFERADKRYIHMVRWQEANLEVGPVFDNSAGVYSNFDVPIQLIMSCLRRLDPRQRPYALLAAHKEFLATLAQFKQDDEDDRNEVIEAVEAAMAAEIERLGLNLWFGCHPDYPDCWGIWPVENEDEDA